MTYICKKRDKCLAYPDRCQGCLEAEVNELLSFEDFEETCTDIPWGFADIYRGCLLKFEEWLELKINYNLLDDNARFDLIAKSKVDKLCN